MYEETGLIIHNIQELILFTSYQPQENIYNIIVGTSCISQNDTIVLSNEHQKYSWMTSDEFLSNHAGYRFIPHRVFNIHSSEFICDIVTKASMHK